MSRQLGLGAVLCALSYLTVTAAARAQAHEGEEAHEAEGPEAHEQPRFKIGIDLVIGPKNTITELTEVAMPDAGRVPIEVESTLPVVESFLLAASVRVADHFSVGARFGLGLSLSSLASNNDVIAAFSNLELEGEYELELGEHTALALSLGLALPTAQGAEPEEGSLDEIRDAAELRLVQRAAAAARGFEDNALFEPGRLGFIPKLLLEHRSGQFVFESYVKLESLVRLGESSERTWLTELVVGGWAGYEVARIVTFGLKLWGNFALHELSESAFIAEPQARVELGPVRAALGFLLPIASNFDQPALIGVRLAATLRL